MKLSEIKGKRAITAFADLIFPVSNIFNDEEIMMDIKADAPKMLIIQKAMRNHADEILEIMAIIDGKDVETYEPSLVEIPKMLLDIITDEAVVELFTSQGQNEDVNVSGSATVNTEEMKN